MNRSKGKTRRRYKQLFDDLKETREYWILKEEALEDSLSKVLWTSRKADYGMNEHKYLSYSLMIQIL
jgi:hypothetical protein